MHDFQPKKSCWFTPIQDIKQYQHGNYARFSASKITLVYTNTRLQINLQSSQSKYRGK
jgi:hypothetical protein